MTYKNQIEALLFASGRLMDIETLMQLTGASSKQVITNNVDRLKEEYTDRDSPLMIVEEKDGWKLTVREDYLSLVRKIISETELPKSVLETLAVVAWQNPVLQSQVVEIRHNKAYEHISELEDLGFLRKEPEGRSYRLHLTEKFYEYFDVEGARDIRDVFNKVVGMPDQTKVDDFDIPDMTDIKGLATPMRKKASKEFAELDDELSELEEGETEGELSELEEGEDEPESQELSELESAPQDSDIPQKEL